MVWAGDAALARDADADGVHGWHPLLHGPLYVAVNPRCSLATHLLRQRPHPAGCGGGALAFPLAGDLPGGLCDGV